MTINLKESTLLQCCYPLEKELIKTQIIGKLLLKIQMINIYF